MLKKHSTDFITYYNVTVFLKKSIESLKLSLQELVNFVDTLEIVPVQVVTHSHLAEFVAGFLAPSVYKKKARVWWFGACISFFIFSP